MTYRVELSKPARKALLTLPKRTRRLVGQRLRALAEDPRPRGAKRLKGALRGLHRLRVGDYRLVYTVEDDVLRMSFSTSETAATCTTGLNCRVHAVIRYPSVRGSSTAPDGTATRPRPALCAEPDRADAGTHRTIAGHCARDALGGPR